MCMVLVWTELPWKCRDRKGRHEVRAPEMMTAQNLGQPDQRVRRMLHIGNLDPGVGFLCFFFLAKVL